MIDAAERALQCLGRGFDVASDFRAKHCKGKQRLILLKEDEFVDLALPVSGGHVLQRVSIDIKCDKGERVRYQSDVLEFNQMSEWFNQRNTMPGKIPSGLFNGVFGFGGSSWAEDAAATRKLAIDGYFISLFDLRIDSTPLRLSDQVIHAVPTKWDPSALSRFIEDYGTHIIIGLSVGGQDVVYVKQDQSSVISPSELKHNLDQLGDQLFTGMCNLPPLHYKSKENKLKISEAFNVFDLQPLMMDGFNNVSCKNGLTVVCSRRGGNVSASSHYEWLLTVPSMPDIINFNFVAITSLMKGVDGAGFLAHAINLYLRYKPPMSELQHFLEFQSHRFWAPLLNDHPLGPSSNLSKRNPSLQLALIGPRLLINTSPVIVYDFRPVTGMRLHLEGKDTNCLAIHLQHLSITPTLFNGNTSATMLRWHGSDSVAAANNNYYEHLDWRRLSHVCTAPVEPNPDWNLSQSNLIEPTYVVAGAQLQMDDGTNTLHLRLLFANLPSSIIRRSVWDRGPLASSSGPSGFLQRSGILSSVTEKEEYGAMPKVVVDSGVFVGGPPEAGATNKLKKYVELREICKGPKDSPGYWVVTGAKLELDKGRIALHVRFSLLTMLTEYDSPSGNSL